MRKMNADIIGDAAALFERDGSASPKLAAELERFARTAEPSNPLVGSAIWALGKRFDQTLKSFFVEMLQRTYRVSPDTGFQCMIALDNLQEDILPGGGAITDTKRNTRLAEAYLRKRKAQQDGGEARG